MRTFPRASRHRLWAASAACSLAIGAMAVPLAHANDDLKHKQKHVQGQIKSADHALDMAARHSERARQLGDDGGRDVALRGHHLVEDLHEARRVSVVPRDERAHIKRHRNPRRACGSSSSRR